MRRAAFRPLALAASVAGLLACSDDTAPARDLGGPLEAAAADLREASIDLRHNEGAKPDSAPSASICGTLLDSAGAKVGGGNLKVCNELDCLTATSDSQGAFCVTIPKPSATYMLQAGEGSAGGQRRGDVIFPVPVTAAEVSGRLKLDVGEVIQPLVATSVTLSDAGGSLDLGGGAKLSVAAGAVTFPPLKSKAEVGFVEVPLAKVHPRLLASWSGATAPVAAFLILPVFVPEPLRFASPAAFELPLSGVKAGTSYELAFANALTAVLEPHLSLDGGAGKLTSPAGKGLSALGWFVVYPK